MAAQAVEGVLARERVSAVLSIGTCGALDSTLVRGEIFVATEIRCARSGRVFGAWRPECARACRTGVLLSVDRVIRTAEEKASLICRGAAVEMEAAAVAALAERHSLPCGAVRVVLDTAEESFSIDFNALRAADGRFRPWGIARWALMHPGSAVPELLRLRRHLNMAADRLGEFLAACRF